MAHRLVDLERGPARYAFVSGDVDSQEAVVRALRGTPIGVLRSRPVRRSQHRHVAEPIRVTCSITPDQRVTGPNEMLAIILGYARQELDGMPVELLAPPERTDAERAALRAQFLALRDGELPELSFSERMRGKTGNVVPYRCTVTWNTLFERWDWIGEVDADHIRGGPQFRTPLDRIPLLEWQVAHQQHRLRDLAQQLGGIDDKHVRQIARDIVHETLLEFVPLKPVDQPEQRDHQGGAPPKFADPQEVVRQVSAIMASSDDFWGMTVQDVLDALQPKLKSRNSLIDYLVRAGRMRKPVKGQINDSLKDTLRDLGREALEHLT